MGTTAGLLQDLQVYPEQVPPCQQVGAGLEADSEHRGNHQLLS